jgi:hypothetical protein
MLKPNISQEHKGSYVLLDNHKEKKNIQNIEFSEDAPHPVTYFY